MTIISDFRHLQCLDESGQQNSKILEDCKDVFSIHPCLFVRWSFQNFDPLYMLYIVLILFQKTPSYCERIEAIRPLMERAPGECIQDLVIRQYVSALRHGGFKSISESRTETVCPPNLTSASSRIASNLSDAFPEGALCTAFDVRVASRPKKGISRLIRERIQRWQADKDRVENGTALKTRIPRLSTVGSNILLNNSKSKPLEALGPEEEASWKTALQSLDGNTQNELTVPVLSELHALESPKSPELYESDIDPPKENIDIGQVDL